MTSSAHDSAVQRLHAGRVEQERLSERYEAVAGTSTELGAYARLEAAGDHVAAREAWLNWIDDKGYRGLDSGPFELLAERSGPRRDNCAREEELRTMKAEERGRAARRPARGEGPDLAEEPLSDVDQTLADNEQTLGDRDQTLSDRDQQASDEDQAASDWVGDHGGDRVAHAKTSAARAGATREREQTSSLRDRTAEQRDIFAQRRDQLSMRRDQFAMCRDKEAGDVDAGNLWDRDTPRVQGLRARGHASRIRAASDRAQSAQDRQRAAQDRQQAAYDRKHAGTDELTGARRRGVGLEELENEIKRARREGHSLVVAYVDVDRLKSVNDDQGHAAGDEVLRTVTEGLRHQMRSYDLLVRLGGDEFLCALSHLTLAETRYRFDAFRAKLKDSEGCSVSVGFSELLDGDSSDELIRRADSNLLARRRR